jgi:hypothetical protein
MAAEVSIGQSVNELPLMVEQGTEDEHWTIFTGLAAPVNNSCHIVLNGEYL